MSDPAEKLSAFTAWAAAHITGDEKGQAQIFLDRLFVAFGHAGSLDVGGEPDFCVRKATEDGGGTSFVDYVWKPVVLIEMKKRGTVLSKHYRPAKARLRQRARRRHPRGRGESREVLQQTHQARRRAPARPALHPPDAHRALRRGHRPAGKILRLPPARRVR